MPPPMQLALYDVVEYVSQTRFGSEVCIRIYSGNEVDTAGRTVYFFHRGAHTNAL